MGFRDLYNTATSGYGQFHGGGVMPGAGYYGGPDAISRAANRAGRRVGQRAAFFEKQSQFFGGGRGRIGMSGKSKSMRSASTLLGDADWALRTVGRFSQKYMPGGGMLAKGISKMGMHGQMRRRMMGVGGVALGMAAYSGAQNLYAGRGSLTGGALAGYGGFRIGKMLGRKAGLAGGIAGALYGFF